jgi:hypothetical protein
MKITFFLIAFCLIFIRLYLGWTGHWRNDSNGGTMTMSNGDDHFEIKWSGKIRLSDDEKAIESISPGGYLKFTHQDEKLLAESNMQGDISYKIYDGQQELAMDEKGKKFLAGAIREMIEFGFDAQGRMDRIYAKGGKMGLLSAEAELKSDNLRGMYIDRLLKTDSLTKDELNKLISQIGEMGSDFEKQQRLNQISPEQLKDSGTVQAWLGIVGHMGDDHGKEELLKHLIDQDTISEEVESKILDLTGQFGGDWEKENLLSELIEKDTVPTGLVDKLLGVIGQFADDHGKEDLFSKLIEKDAVPADHFGRLLGLIGKFAGDFEKENLYRKLILKNQMSEEEWAVLINRTSDLSSDFEKSNMLVDIAAKMPKTENLRTEYLKVAKTINADPEYGKAVRAVE